MSSLVDTMHLRDRKHLRPFEIPTPGAKTIKKNTNSTQNKFQTHRAKQYEVTSFLSTDCELSTETCSKNVYSLGPRSVCVYQKSSSGLQPAIKPQNKPQRNLTQFSQWHYFKQGMGSSCTRMPVVVRQLGG